MNSIAVFKWKGKLPAEDEVGTEPNNFFSKDFGEQWAYQACQPVAAALLKSVRDCGYTTDVDKPYEGELGWHFSIIHDGKDYHIFMMWASIEKQDYFVIQPSIRRGCLPSLFLRRLSESTLQPVCEILKQAIPKISYVTDIQWLTEKQFDECYRLGKPLVVSDS